MGILCIFFIALSSASRTFPSTQKVLNKILFESDHIKDPKMLTEVLYPQEELIYQ